MSAQEALGRQWGGTELRHMVVPAVAKAIKQGRIRHLSGLEESHRSMASFTTDQPHTAEDIGGKGGMALSRIKPGAKVVFRGEDEEPGDEDITATHPFWRPEGFHNLDIHNPRAVSQFHGVEEFHGKQYANPRPGAPKLESWANNEFYHHTSNAAAQDILGRLHRGEPGLLLSRGGDTGPGIYTSADKTAWSNIGHRREHPGWEFAMHLRGFRSLGAGPGGENSLYAPDPPKLVARRFHNIGREGDQRGRWGQTQHRGGVDPNFWREHGYDTVVTGGKETIATHPLQVQMLRATDKSTGRVHHFEDEVYRHYKRFMPVQESDYSPRQERN